MNGLPLTTSPEVELMETFGRLLNASIPALTTSPEVELMETSCNCSGENLATSLTTSPEVELMETFSPKASKAKLGVALDDFT